jgi:cytochrome bd-type quinol oxidase subunit 2
MAELLNNETFVWGCMSVIAFLITQGLKWLLVKPYTKNLDKRKKAIINSVILLISFGVVVLCEFAYSGLWLKEAMDLPWSLLLPAAFYLSL